MVKRNKRSTNKNTIQNVRVVDKDEGTDDVVLQRLLQAYNTSEGQIRVVCIARQQLDSPATATGGTFGYLALAASDDFISMAAQYTEFRVRGIRFDVYDINPSSPPTINYWSTFHAVDTTVDVGAEDVIDRPDSRSVVPGTGHITLAWLAHGIPEMEFQATTSYERLGGLSYNVQSATTGFNSKYSVVGKFLVDFRGRR
jgi:hypothetical protein